MSAISFAMSLSDALDSVMNTAMLMVSPLGPVRMPTSLNAAVTPRHDPLVPVL